MSALENLKHRLGNNKKWPGEGAVSPLKIGESAIYKLVKLGEIPQVWWKRSWEERCEHAHVSLKGSIK